MAQNLRPRNARRASRSDEWPTPHLLRCALVHRFGPFTLDPCATEANACAPSFYTRNENGLSDLCPWYGRVYVNPPYGRSIHKWVRKGWEAAEAGAVVVMLLPANTDTAWWHDYCERGNVRFIRGRLNYGDGIGRAPFGSAVVSFGTTRRMDRYEV